MKEGQPLGSVYRDHSYDPYCDRVFELVHCSEGFYTKDPNLAAVEHLTIGKKVCDALEGFKAFLEEGDIFGGYNED